MTEIRARPILASPSRDAATSLRPVRAMMEMPVPGRYLHPHGMHWNRAGPRNCDDGKMCTTDSCDPATGCVNANNTLECDDGDACTAGDACVDGSCLSDSPTDCEDGNLCTDNPCDPETGCDSVDISADL